MIHDICAIISHEWRGYFRYRESTRSGWLRWSALLILSTMIIRVLGPGFGASWPTIPAVAFVTIIFIPAVVADSFAGERERHTLETLLASRISDTALLLGKFVANLLYGMLAAVAMIIIGLGFALFYQDPVAGLQVRPEILGATLMIALLSAGSITGIGILVSLRAPTVRRATESLTIILMLAAFSSVALIELPLPNRVWEIAEWAVPMGEDGPGLVAFLMVAGFLLALNTILLGIAMRRFRRARLIS